jgi:predicted acetyltransferase
MKIEMRELVLDDAIAAARIHKVMKEQDDFAFLLSDYQQDEDFEPYLERVAAYKDATTVPEGKVVSTFWVAVVDGKIAGRISIRHSLNDFLAAVGGHIGYGVAPEFRGLGIATYMLQFGLRYLREIGVDRCFISCKVGNDYSQRTIEKCGGHFAAVVEDPTTPGAMYRTYWISTAA